MGRQVIAMGMGMGCMFCRERGLFDGLVFRMRQRVSHRVVPGIFQLAIPILTGSCFYRNSQNALVFWRGLSWRHNE